MKTPDEDSQETYIESDSALQRLEALDALVELLSESKEAIKGVNTQIATIDKEIEVLQLQRQRLVEAETACKRMLLDGLPGQLDPGEYKYLRIAIYDLIQCASATKLKQARPVGPIQPLPPPTTGDWYKFAVDSEEAGQLAMTRGLEASQYREGRAPWDLPVAFGEVLSALKDPPEKTTDNAALKETLSTAERLLSAEDVAESFEAVKATDRIVSMSVPDPDEEDGFTDVLIDENPPSPPWVPAKPSLIDRVFNWVMDRLS